MSQPEGVARRASGVGEETAASEKFGERESPADRASGKNFAFSLDTSVLSAVREGEWERRREGIRGEGEDLTIFDVRSKYTI